MHFPSFTLVSVSNGYQSTYVHVPENSSLLLPFFRIIPASWGWRKGKGKEETYNTETLISIIRGEKKKKIGGQKTPKQTQNSVLYLVVTGP